MPHGCSPAQSQDSLGRWFSSGKGQMTDLDLGNLKQRMLEALTAMGYETDVLCKSAAADTFYECLRLTHERGRHVLIIHTPSGIGIEFLR
jgi:hypothetical protein